jgi:hypothetical protein
MGHLMLWFRMMPGLIGSGTTEDNVTSDFMAPLMCWNGNISMCHSTTLDMILLSAMSVLGFSSGEVKSCPTPS